MRNKLFLFFMLHLLFASVLFSQDDVKGTYKLVDNPLEMGYKEIIFSEKSIMLDGKKIAYAELESIKTSNDIVRRDKNGFVELNNESRFYFNSVKFEKEKLVIQNAHLNEIEIPILDARMISFINEENREFEKDVYQKRYELSRNDVLRLKNDDLTVSIEGIVNQFDDNQLVVNWGGKERKIDLEKVLMIKFSTAKPKPKFKGYILHLTDGSKLYGNKILSEGGQIVYGSDGLTISFPAGLLSAVEIIEKTVVPLSSLKMASEKKEGVLLDNRGVEIDRSYHKKELASAKRMFQNGFGVHSNSEISFDLPEGVTEISGAVCLEKSHSEVGDCIVEIIVDSKSVWSANLNAKSSDVDFKLPLDSGVKLVLVVMHGENLDPGDSVIWGDVKLKIKD